MIRISTISAESRAIAAPAFFTRRDIGLIIHCLLQTPCEGINRRAGLTGIIFLVYISCQNRFLQPARQPFTGLTTTKRRRHLTLNSEAGMCTGTTMFHQGFGRFFSCTLNAKDHRDLFSMNTSKANTPAKKLKMLEKMMNKEKFCLSI